MLEYVRVRLEDVRMRCMCSGPDGEIDQFRLTKRGSPYG